MQAVRRLTRLHVRSVEEPINLNDANVYDWPWLYAVQAGHWQLTDAQAKVMREYLLRGGFFMADDFWGDNEWAVFMASMKKVFPDREVVELDNKEQIFHAVYNLDSRYQVASRARCAPGAVGSAMAARTTGAAFSTTAAASWWRLRSNPTSAIRGSGPTRRLSRALCRARNSHRHQLHHLFDDPLARNALWYTSNQRCHRTILFATWSSSRSFPASRPKCCACYRATTPKSMRSPG